MHKTLIAYLTFSKRERNAILLLSFALIAMLIIPGFTEKQKYEIAPSDPDFFEKAAAFFAPDTNTIHKNYPKRNYSKKNIVLKPILFSPDTMQLDDWLKMGMPEYVSKNLSNYTSKGGKFFKKEDFKRIYGLNEGIYKQIEPFIVIPEKKNYKNEAALHTKKESKELIRININAADTLEMLAIKGVGPAVASRIFRYRERLGGFVSQEQLYEIWGIDSARAERLMAQIEVADENIRLLRINFASIEELAYHPYISWTEARAIITYINKFGMINSCEELADKKILAPITIEKLCIYLSFN